MLVGKPTESANRQVVNKFKVFAAFIFGAGLSTLLLSFSPIQMGREEESIKYETDFERYKYKAQEILKSLTRTDTDPLSNTTAKNARSKSNKILCWIMTFPKYHMEKAIHVKNTWGKRCDKLIFMSSETDIKLGAVGLPHMKEGRNELWEKTKESLKYLWTMHRDEADWFFKADEDTYVIMENLRFLLSKYDPKEPVYLGAHLTSIDKNYKKGYMAGGAGYVLSREAVRKFIEIPSNHTCLAGEIHSDQIREDAELGECLDDVEVDAGDSRDKLGRYRFLQYPPAFFLPFPSNPRHFYWTSIKYPQKEGEECCSSIAVSFHKINVAAMHLLEYLIYRVKPLNFSSKSHFYSPYQKEKQNTLISARESLFTAETNEF